MRLDQRLQLPNEALVLAELEVGVDPQLERMHTELLEAHCRRTGELLVRDVDERRAAPERERASQLVRRVGGVASAQRRVAALEPVLEDGQVELVTAEHHDVPGPARVDRVLETRGLEHLPKLRDPHAQGLRAARGRVLAPELVDKPLGRDDPVGVQEENRQQRLLLQPTQAHDVTAMANLQGAKNAELHRSLDPGT